MWNHNIIIQRGNDHRQNLNLTFRYGKHTQFMCLVMITNRPKK